MGSFFARLLLLPALLLGGCASVTAFKGLPLDDGGLYVSGVPPIRQDARYACGAACVAGVASYWGVELADFRTAHPQLPAPATGGDLQRIAEGLGLRAFVFRGSLEDLEENLGKGRPLIVMIPKPELPRAGLAGALFFSAWNEIGRRPAHWVVVVGLTPKRDVIIHDPASGLLTIRNEKFRAWWAQKDHASVLIAAR